MFENLKRVRPGTVAACLALVLALGGTATAASGLISGKKIKRGTITGKQIKNHSVPKAKLTPGAIKSLKGQRGPQGSTGKTGAQGDPGKNGVVTPFSAVFSSINLPSNTELALGTMNVPADKYMITGTVLVSSSAGTPMRCHISTNGNGGNSESAAWYSQVPNTKTSMSLQMVTESSEVTQITIACHPGVSLGTASGQLIAVPVQ